MMTNDELLTEAREFLATPNLGKSMMRELDKAMIYIRRLADALEARQSSENDRERLARLLAAQDGEEWDRLVGTAEYARNRYLRKAGAILDRMPKLSRAAVPDAATELRRGVTEWAKRFIPCDRWDTEDLRDLESAMNGNVEASPDRRRARSEIAEAERDAALVAAQGAAPQVESAPKSSYISPSLPAMIRNLWKSDPSENSVRTALKLAGDLIQELIDLKAAPVLPLSGVDEERLAEYTRVKQAEALEEAAEMIHHKQHAESVRQMLFARADEYRKAVGSECKQNGKHLSS